MQQLSPGVILSMRHRSTLGSVACGLSRAVRVLNTGTSRAAWRPENEKERGSEREGMR